MMSRYDEYIDVLKQNRFYLLLLSSTVSNIGDWLSIVALMVLCYGKTGSPLGVSGILIARVLPSIIFGFLSGTVADRFDRKKIIVTTNVMRGISILSLAFVDHVVFIYFVSFLSAAIGSFFNPAVDSIIPGLVGKSRVVLANALITIGKMLAMVAGPAMAALSIKYFGYGTTFFLDAISFLMFALVLLAIPIKAGAPICLGGLRGILNDNLDGVKYLLSDRFASSILGSYFFAYCTMGALGTLELVFCSKVLMLNSAAYGKIISIAGVGAIGGSIFSGLYKGWRPIEIYLWGLSIFGAGIMLFGLQTTLYAAIPFLLMEGVGESFFTIGGRSYLQNHFPTELLGKVMAYMEMMQKTGMLLGMISAGIVATYISIVTSLEVYGMLIILVSAVILLAKSFQKRCLSRI